MYRLIFIALVTFLTVPLKAQLVVPWEHTEDPVVLSVLLKNIPYYVQPDSRSCQSTVLLSVAGYLDNRWDVTSKNTGTTIQDIYLDVNSDRAERPVKGVYNSWENLRWWLDQYTRGSVSFRLTMPKNTTSAQEYLVAAIDAQWPVIASVSHDNTRGHIVLVVGYHVTTSGKYFFSVYDPYGEFDPSVRSALWGANRYVGGQTLLDGSQSGPGKHLSLPAEALSRRNPQSHSYGRFVFISPE